MEDIIDIIVTETTNTIEITAQPNDEIIDVNIIDNREDVTLNVTPTLIEVNINSLTGNFGVNWGEIEGTLSNQTDLQDALNLKADLVGGKVPSSQLPSYVDDVVEVANYASLPATGETGKIYVTIDTNYIYRWTGSVYVEIKDSSAVWGAITGSLSSQTDLQSALNAKQASLSGSGIVKSTSGTISYLTDNSTNWNTAYNDSIVSASVAGTTTKTLTLTQQDGGTVTASWTDLNTDAVSSVFGRTGAVVAASGDYTTAQVTEVTNLYYTDARARASVSAGTGISYNSTTGVITNTITQYTDALARAALSFTAGSGAYNSTTGVITIPTNTNQLTNGASFITLGSLSAGTGISYNNTTGVITNTITQYTDALARAAISGGTGISYNSTTGVITNTITQYTDALVRAAISLTVSGSSGASTYNSTTGVLNVPTYTLSGLGGQPALNGTGFVKIIGTTISYDNSTYLTTSSASSTYLPLAGGTLTGALNGTSATFSSSVTVGSYLNIYSGAYATQTISSIRASSSNNLILNAASTGTLYLNYETGSGGVYFGNGASGQAAFITSAGAATFSSSVSTGSDLYVNGNSVIGNSNAGISNAGTTRLTLQNTTLTNSRGIGFYANDGTQNPRSWIKHITASGSQYMEFSSDYSTASSFSNFIFQNGNVGIGTTSPNRALEITTTNTTPLRLTTTGGNTGIEFLTSSSTYNWRIGGQLAVNNFFEITPSTAAGGTTFTTPAFGITSGGNVIIGTTTDAGYKLDVNGTGRFTGAVAITTALGLLIQASSEATIRLNNTGGGTEWRLNSYTNSNLYFQSGGGATNAVYFTSAGAATFSSSVTATQGTFYVGDAVNGTYFLGGSGNTARQLKFSTSTTTNVGDTHTIDAQSASGVINFATTSAIKMTIANSGNVGIGTTSPGYKLDILADSTTGSSNGIKILAGTNSSDYALLVNNQTNTLNRFVVRGDGNVGIGTSSPSATLSVVSSIANTTAANIYTKNTTSISYSGVDMYNDTNVEFFIGVGGSGAPSGYTNNAILETYSTTPMAFRTGGSERMRITSGGSVGIGTSSPSFVTGNGLAVFSTSADTRIALKNTASGDASTDGFHLVLTTALEAVIENRENGSLRFLTNATEAMRITSVGDLCIGKTSSTWSIVGLQTEVNGSSLGITNASSNVNNLFLRKNGIAGNVASFYYDGTNVGTISITSSATSYNTSSDYRLKEDLKPINGLEIVNKIKVYDYKWKASSDRMDGVLAHELAEVLPYAVQGIKDGEQMQGVDYSKIVPVMVQAIKDLKAELDTLKNK